MSAIRRAARALFLALGIVKERRHDDWPLVERRRPPLSPEHAREREARDVVRAALADVVYRIRALKAVRNAPGQPGWADSNNGLALEQQKGMATLLCLARARARGRRHVVVLPRQLHLPAGEGRPWGQCVQVPDQASLDALCDGVVERLVAQEPAVPTA